jgi:outer membrane protein
MNKSIRSLVALAAVAAFAVVARAQPAVKILVVDMAKIYDNHYKTADFNARLQADDQKAQEEVERMNKEGNAIVDEYKSLEEQANKNPLASAEAKSKAQGDAQKKLEQIQEKKNEIGSFIQNTRNTLQQRLQTFRSVLLEEISKTATDVAKRKGATILLDKAGPTAIGISSIVYADPAYEITDEVLKEVNKDRPATPAATATPSAPSTSAAPAAPAPAQSTGSGPTITVPGVTSPKK